MYLIVFLNVVLSMKNLALGDQQYWWNLNIKCIYTALKWVYFFLLLILHTSHNLCGPSRGHSLEQLESRKSPSAVSSQRMQWCHFALQPSVVQLEEGEASRAEPSVGLFLQQTRRLGLSTQTRRRDVRNFAKRMTKWFRGFHLNCK